MHNFFSSKISTRNFLQSLAALTLTTGCKSTPELQHPFFKNVHYGSCKRLPDGDVLVTMSSDAIRNCHEKIKPIFSKVNARIWQAHASFQDIKFGKVEASEHRLFQISSGLDKYELFAALDYSPTKPDLVVTKTQLFRENKSITNIHEVFEVAKLAGLENTSTLLNHQRLSVDNDDAQYWLDRQLTYRQLFASLISRRIMIEIAAALGVEIENQGTLSELVGINRSSLEEMLLKTAQSLKAE